VPAVALGCWGDRSSRMQQECGGVRVCAAEREPFLASRVEFSNRVDSSRRLSVRWHQRRYHHVSVNRCQNPVGGGVTYSAHRDMSADRGRPHTSTALWKARDIHDMLPNFQLACSFELDFSYHADLPLVQPLKLGDRRPTIPQLFAPPRKQSRRWSNHQHQKNQQTTLRNIQLAICPLTVVTAPEAARKWFLKTKKQKP
jgi:hypothetical protein